MSLAAWTVAPGAVRIRVRLTPKSSRDEIGGVEETSEGPALKARVRAVPEDGKANAALIRLMADWLDVPKSTIALVSGGKSRCKMLAVSGSETMLAERLGMRLKGAGREN